MRINETHEAQVDSLQEVLPGYFTISTAQAVMNPKGVKSEGTLRNPAGKKEKTLLNPDELGSPQTNQERPKASCWHRFRTRTSRRALLLQRTRQAGDRCSLLPLQLAFWLVACSLRLFPGPRSTCVFSTGPGGAELNGWEPLPCPGGWVSQCGCSGLHAS